VSVYTKRIITNIPRDKLNQSVNSIKCHLTYLLPVLSNFNSLPSRCFAVLDLTFFLIGGLIVEPSPLELLFSVLFPLCVESEMADG